MLTPYVCPKCGTKGTVSSNLIGKSIRCIHCSAEIFIKTQLRSKKSETFMIVDSDDLTVEEPESLNESTNIYQPLMYPKPTTKKIQTRKVDNSKDITRILTKKVSEKLAQKNSSSQHSNSEEIDADDLAIDTSTNVKYITKKFKQDSQQETQRQQKQKEKEETKRVDNLEELVKTKKFMELNSPYDRRVPCPHCGSIILQKDRICKFCEKEIDLTAATSVKVSSSYTNLKNPNKKTEDTQIIQIVKSKRYKKHNISYFRIFGGFLLFVSLFLPWFGSSVGIQIAFEREIPKTISPLENNTPAEIQISKSKTQMFVQAFITPAIFALTMIGLLIAIFEFIGKKLHIIFSFVPVIMVLFLFVALKEVQWQAMNFAVPLIIIGCILIFIPGKRIKSTATKSYAK